MDMNIADAPFITAKQQGKIFLRAHDFNSGRKIAHSYQNVLLVPPRKIIIIGEKAAEMLIADAPP